MTAERERVVLAERRGARLVRPRAEVQEQTEVGDALIRGLIRTQRALAVRTAVVVLVLIGLFPLLIEVVPALGTSAIAGIKLPWIVLGALAYAVMIGAGLLYVRAAARNEREFVELVED